jgi:hypothetical protein
VFRGLRRETSSRQTRWKRGVSLIALIAVMSGSAVVVVGATPAVAHGSRQGAHSQVADTHSVENSGMLPSCVPTPSKPCPEANSVWSGYVVTPLSGGQFTSVSAKWVQTRASCGPGRDAWALFWAGLDGIRSMTVEQGGSEAQCVNGTPQYYAWWEMYPTNDVQPAFPVAVGDHISASVVYSSAADTYTVTVDDTTSGQSVVVVCWTNASAVNPNMYTISLDGGPPNGPTSFPPFGNQTGILCGSGNPCENASAEWVVEAPGGDSSRSGGLYPLAHFRPVTFQSANAVDASGDNGSISDPAWQHMGYDLTSTSGETLAVVSQLRGAGSRFRDVKVNG